MGTLRLKNVRHILVAVGLFATLLACKSKQASKSAPDPQAASKASCQSSGGTWQTTYCQCPSGKRQDSANANRCVDVPKPQPSDCTGSTHWDSARADCVSNTDTQSLIQQSRTARECFDRGGWWNSTTCGNVAPTTQQGCQINGDQWSTTTCQRIDPANKQQVCTAGGGSWADSGCTCQSPQTFDWITYHRCVAQSNNGGTGPGQYAPDQACTYGNGNWDGSGCVCPQGTQLDPSMGRCVPNRGYTPYCPGQFDPQGNCYTMSGQQMLYSLLYGWILQSLYLDDPNKPDEVPAVNGNSEQKGDGH